jgi:hypothetical protein
MFLCLSKSFLVNKLLDCSWQAMFWQGNLLRPLEFLNMRNGLHPDQSVNWFLSRRLQLFWLWYSVSRGSCLECLNCFVTVGTEKPLSWWPGRGRSLCSCASGHLGCSFVRLEAPLQCLWAPLGCRLSFLLIWSLSNCPVPSHTSPPCHIVMPAQDWDMKLWLTTAMTTQLGFVAEGEK